MGEFADEGFETLGIVVDLGEAAQMGRIELECVLGNVDADVDNRGGARQTPGIEFWQQAAASIAPSATPDLALVTIAKPGVRLRYKGGEVRSVNRRALALPNASETIDGAATHTLATQYQILRVQSNGTNWDQI